MIIKEEKEGAWYIIYLYTVMPPQYPDIYPDTSSTTVYYFTTRYLAVYCCKHSGSSSKAILIEDLIFRLSVLILIPGTYAALPSLCCSVP